MKKIIALVLGLVLISVGIAAAKGKTTKKEAKPVSNSQRLEGFYKDVMNAHNAEAVEEYCANGFTDHNPDPGQKSGKDGLKEAFKGFFAAFPDLHVKVEKIVEQGDWVVARITMSGTQRGEFMGMPASKKKFKIQGMDMIRIKNGKATDRWGNFDQVEMMEQLTPKKKADKK